jgi:hypothetical protein
MPSSREKTLAVRTAQRCGVLICPSEKESSIGGVK